jgi:hypothetical protein
MNTLIGEDITAETMVGVMMESTKRWNIEADFIHQVMQKKEEEERQRQRERV